MKLRVIAMVLLVSAPALAQKKSDDCAEQRRRNPKAACTLEIEGSTLEGQNAGPPGETVTGRKDSERGSLIRVRSDWNDRLISSTRRM